ncbi:TIM barrel protein [Microbacterium jepli]|uniref:TIM barrel protein n=1 Tax=Microbacterium sp. 1P10UE TaxID=3132288 RepID=UPI0039A185EB
MSAVTELVMWEGSVRSLSYALQLEATVEAGFGGLALTPSAFRSAMVLHGAEGVRRLAAEYGIRLHLDTVTGWAPIRVPSGADEALLTRFNFSVNDCLKLVDALNLQSILAVAVFDHDSVPFDDLVRGFAELCDRAAERQVPVNLEFMPFWGVPDLAAAWAIVQAADRGAGIMVDTWHFAHSGADLDLLRSIPAEVPIHLQLADGVLAKPGTDLIEATLHTRRPPGLGELGVRAVVDAVTSRPPAITAGPEVFSDELDNADPVDIGRILGSSTRKVLAIV